MRLFLLILSRQITVWILVVFLGVSSPLNAQVASPDAPYRVGKKLYKESCQSCHGDKGQGVNEFYANPLVGDLSIGELSELISETMPEGDPEACVAKDARAVAQYIHHSFYSEAAQVRNRPPQISMSRLTGEQLRQSLADLYGHFSDSDPWIESRRGFKGIYFDGARWKKEKIRIERVDPVLDFDFGDKGPGSKINPNDFYIHWAGSLKVDRSGRYEIVLRSSCSCVMYFGKDDRELINNHVQSEGKDEFRKSMNLTAGRAYPIKIEFFQRKRKTEQPPAKLSLSWVPPGGVEEVIPTRNLIDSWMPASFALQAKLPPDDRSYGYERGTAINRIWDESTTNAALEFAQLAADELYPQYRRRHQKDKDDNRQILKQFLLELVQTAFRGKLDDATRALYIDRHVDAVADDAAAIKRVALISLKSPRFLYPSIEGDRSKSQRVANRLALVMFDSLPSDKWLQKIVDKNQLQTSRQIGDVAWRMAHDYRSQAKMRAFLYEWLDLSHLGEVTKDNETFPNFNRKVANDLKKSFNAFLDEIVWNEASDFRQLIQADWMYTNDTIASYYGDKWKPKEGNGEVMRRSVSDSSMHVGVLTHPLLLSHFAYHKTSSPIHRGVFLTRHVLGRVIRPPNAAFSPINPDLHPELTTRERVELQTGEVNCQVCHEKINALGFALENFDATGRFRANEKKKTIDASGSYLSRQGESHRFRGARELGDFLASSKDCHRAFVEAAFEHFVKQPISAFGLDTSDRLTKQFQDSGYSIRKLVVAIAMIAASGPPNPGSGT